MNDTRQHLYGNLQRQLGIEQPLPYTPHWTAAADFLEEITRHCLATKPALILECSSGLSTLVLARCCQLTATGQVISMENGTEFIAATEGNLKRFQVDEHATVVHCPLRNTRLDQQDFQWYSPPPLQQKIDMLVVDGPSGFLQPLSRYPALPILYDQLAEQCTLFLDDAGREDEREIIRRWLATYPEFEYRYLATERGCSILSRG